MFLVGFISAVITLWIRRAVPETDTWTVARTTTVIPPVTDLFRGALRRTTLLSSTVCGLMLTAHWALMFWYLQHVRSLTEFLAWSPAERTLLASIALLVVMITLIIGDFCAALLAHRLGWRRAVALLSIAYTVLVTWGFSVPRPLAELWPFLTGIGICQGVFALFTMYLPPLFPTLPRTTGAGLCYNTRRIFAACGTVVFVTIAPLGQVRIGLVIAATLFIPAAILALFLPPVGDR